MEISSFCYLISDKFAFNNRIYVPSISLSDTLVSVPYSYIESVFCTQNDEDKGEQVWGAMNGEEIENLNGTHTAIKCFATWPVLFFSGPGPPLTSVSFPRFLLHPIQIHLGPCVVFCFLHPLSYFSRQ